MLLEFPLKRTQVCSFLMDHGHGPALRRSTVHNDKRIKIIVVGGVLLVSYLLIHKSYNCAIAFLNTSQRLLEL